MSETHKAHIVTPVLDEKELLLILNALGMFEREGVRRLRCYLEHHLDALRVRKDH